MGKGFGLDCCDQCMRWLLFAWCLICLLAGGGVVGVGAWILADEIYMANLLSSNMYVASAAVLISAGSVTFILSFIGCLGALKKSRCLLMTYGALLLTILIVMVIAGILGFVFTKDKFTGEELEKHLLDTMTDYKKDENIKEAWDDTQSLLECCGTNGPSDWLLNLQSIPKSCYEDEKHPTSMYLDGCWKKVEDAVEATAIIIGAVGIAIGVLLLLGVIFSCCLAKNV